MPSLILSEGIIAGGVNLPKFGEHLQLTTIFCTLSIIPTGWKSLSSIRWL
jgi:hypothetical protein